METKHSNISTFFKGMGMGIAEVIPGVSGGTIAFITGIYETLLRSIKSFGPSLIGTFKSDGFKGLWSAVNGTFLLFLIMGMMVGFGAGVFGISHLLENHPLLLWSFFFGLILASSIYIGSQVGKWTWKEIVLTLLTTAIAYYITIATPAQGSEAGWYIFICGVIAISALILPGLSGSFMLLLLGMYTFLLPQMKTMLKTFSTDAMINVGIFAGGCFVGLFSFSHILSWTFKNYRSATLAALTGFMIGSLNKVWPWQQVLKTRMNSHGEEVIAFSKSVLPNTLSHLSENFLYGTNPQLIACIGLMIVGALSVLALSRFDQKKDLSS